MPGDDRSTAPGEPARGPAGRFRAAAAYCIDAAFPSALVNTPDAELLRTLIDWRRAGRAVKLVTVASTWGSSPRPPGSMAIVRDDGAVAGSVSGGCIERQLVEARAGADSRVSVDALSVADEDARRVGLTCGGRLELVFEAIDDPAEFERALGALEARASGWCA